MTRYASSRASHSRIGAPALHLARRARARRPAAGALGRVHPATRRAVRRQLGRRRALHEVQRKVCGRLEPRRARHDARRLALARDRGATRRGARALGRRRGTAAHRRAAARRAAAVVGAQCLRQVLDRYEHALGGLRRQWLRRDAKEPGLLGEALERVVPAAREGAVAIGEARGVVGLACSRVEGRPRPPARARGRMCAETHPSAAAGALRLDGMPIRHVAGILLDRTLRGGQGQTGFPSSCATVLGSREAADGSPPLRSRQ